MLIGGGINEMFTKRSAIIPARLFKVSCHASWSGVYLARCLLRLARLESFSLLFSYMPSFSSELHSKSRTLKHHEFQLNSTLSYLPLFYQGLSSLSLCMCQKLTSASARIIGHRCWNQVCIVSFLIFPLAHIVPTGCSPFRSGRP